MLVKQLSLFIQRCVFFSESPASFLIKVNPKPPGLQLPVWPPRETHHGGDMHREAHLLALLSPVSEQTCCHFSSQLTCSTGAHGSVMVPLQGQRHVVRSDAGTHLPQLQENQQQRVWWETASITYSIQYYRLIFLKRYILYITFDNIYKHSTPALYNNSYELFNLFLYFIATWQISCQ